MSNPAFDFRFHIDHPSDWRLKGRGVVVRGWGFTRDGQPLGGVRLASIDFVFAGRCGLPRPDVRRALPEAPNENTGFEIRGTLPPGRFPVRLELQRVGGEWQPVAEHEIQVTRKGLPVWLGGGCPADLISFQMPAHPTHPARPVKPERFPLRSSPLSHPTLSIVTPSYNQAAFLGETMRSVLEQDAAVDYVVQDGGSTDGSKALIEAIDKGDRRPEAGIKESAHIDSRAIASGLPSASGLPFPSSPLPPPVSGLRPPGDSPRLVAWASEPDKGQADAIAKGFAKTSGGPDDIMAWINSDDFYLPGALGYVADYFARHPEVDVIYGHRILVDEKSQEVGRWFLPKHNPEVLRLNDFVPQETLFWRRRIWDKVGGLDTSFQFALDWDLLLRFAAAGARIIRVPYFLACFRLHPAQKTSAAMHSIGQKEIDRLRTRTHGREIPPAELERDPRLLRYLRRSAFIEWLWSLGIRYP